MRALTRLLMVLMLAPFLAAGSCQTKRDVLVQTRPPAPIVVKYYVPIPDYLTAPCPIPEGSLVEVIDVAKKRKEALKDCNTDKANIARIQGTKVPEKDSK